MEHGGCTIAIRVGKIIVVVKTSMRSDGLKFKDLDHINDSSIIDGDSGEGGEAPDPDGGAGGNGEAPDPAA